MKKSTLSPFAFGWLTAILIITAYIIGGGLITMLAADSISMATGEVEIGSRNLFLAAAVGQILFLLIPTLVVSQLHPFGPIESLRLRRPKTSHIVLAILGIVACYVLSATWMIAQELYMVPDALRPFYNEMKGSADWLAEKMMVGTDIPLLLLGLFAIAVVPAFSEELLFRGIIQRSFEDRLKPFAAMLLTGLIFGLIHAEPTNLIPLVGLGIFLGFMAWASQSIWTVIVGHMFFNGSQLLLINLVPQSAGTLLDPEAAPMPQDLITLLPLAVVSLVALVAIILRMNREVPPLPPIA